MGLNTPFKNCQIGLNKKQDSTTCCLEVTQKKTLDKTLEHGIFKLTNLVQNIALSNKWQGLPNKKVITEDT